MNAIDVAQHLPGLRASHRLPTVEGSYSVCISFAVLVAMLVSVYSRLCGCRRNRDCVVNLGRFQRVRPTVERNGHPGGSRHLVWRKKEAISIEIPRCPSVPRLEKIRLFGKIDLTISR